jgi:hypothetical protein
MPGAWKATPQGAWVAKGAVTVSAAPQCASRDTVTMVKKSVSSLKEGDLKGKRVFVRVDLNVPLDGKTITDDTRIRASVPTIKYLVDNGAKVGPGSFPWACAILGFSGALTWPPPIPHFRSC